jgi:hypothetical protein
MKLNEQFTSKSSSLNTKFFDKEDDGAIEFKIIEHYFMDTVPEIIFTEDEWGDIKKLLTEGKVVYTLRVAREYGKYKKGDILKTEWGPEINICSVQKVTGGLRELKREYIHFNVLSNHFWHFCIEYLIGCLAVQCTVF